jgi:two-component system response regulator
MTPLSLEILLVEDDPNDIELTLRAFKTHHLANRIQVCRDGAEAVDYMFGEGQYKGRNVEITPKVVILDLKLPKVSGLEVLEKIKGDPRTKSVPVVVLTSSAEERDLVDCYRLGVNSYIVKPVDFEKFMEAAQKVGLYWLLLNQAPH